MFHLKGVGRLKGWKVKGCRLQVTSCRLKNWKVEGCGVLGVSACCGILQFLPKTPHSEIRIGFAKSSISETIDSPFGGWGAFFYKKT
jgi:hypothetical protein